MSETPTEAYVAAHSDASDGQSSGGQRPLLSNEFGLAVLIAATFLVLSISLEGFTTIFSQFTIGRKNGIDACLSYCAHPGCFQHPGSLLDFDCHNAA